jgi:TolB-like protein/tetratricopeptide (TPR) repeat protein
VNDTPTERGAESTWTRLRRRKVVQWGLVYVAGAWGLLQGVAYLRDTFNVPQAVQQIATLLLVIGLPVVLVLAWYHGDRGARRASGTELTIVALLLLLGGGVVWYYQRAAETSAVASQDPPGSLAIASDASIAVLPFVNMSADKEQEYFADGISEELLNLLAQVPGLRVIARTSSFSFKGKEVDITEIARRLNVANVLEGSVRKSGDTLRITAQLVRASDSSHLWSQTFDRQMTDVFKVQDEIAAAVVDELKVKLLGGAPNPEVTDPRAYALFLQGREVARRSNPAAVEQAVALYKQALAIDPTYAPAWDSLADAYYNQMDVGLLAIDQGLPLARTAIKQALISDPAYAPVFARAALVEGGIAGDLASAAKSLEQGFVLEPANIELMGAAVKIARRLNRMQQTVDLAEYLAARDPANAYSHEQLGISYIDVGRLHDAAAAFRTALKLSPEYGGPREMLGEVLLLQGDAEAAVAEMHREPVESYRLIGLSMAYHALGRKAESDAALDELIRKYGRTMPYSIASTLSLRGEINRAFEWLEKAVEYGDVYLSTLAYDSYMENLRADPRWLPLLRRLGKAPEQLAAIKFDVKVPR